MHLFGAVDGRPRPLLNCHGRFTASITTKQDAPPKPQRPARQSQLGRMQESRPLATRSHRARAPQVYRTPSMASRLDLRSPNASKPAPGSVWPAVRPDPTGRSRDPPLLALPVLPAAVAFPSSAPCTHAAGCSHTSTTGVPRPNRGRAKTGSSAATPRHGKPSRSRLGGVTTPRHRVGPRQTPLQSRKGAQPALIHVGGMHRDTLDGADGASHNGAPLRSALLDDVCDAPWG